MGEGFSVRHPKKNVVLHNPQAKNYPVAFNRK